MASMYIFKDNDKKEVEKFVGIEIYSTPEKKGIGGLYKDNYKQDNNNFNTTLK